MKLIDILVRELPKRGGWPEGIEEIWQDYDGLIRPGEFGWYHDQIAEDHRRKHEDAHVKIHRKKYEAALAASKTEWDGEGWPAVGCSCQYTKKSLPGDKWTDCTIDYVGSSFFVYRDCYGVELTGIKGDISFRPIRSEADKKRRDGVLALARVDGLAAPFEYGSKMSDGSLIGSFWYDLYDAIAAGKIPGIRID